MLGQVTGKARELDELAGQAMMRLNTGSSVSTLLADPLRAFRAVHTLHDFREAQTAGGVQAERLGHVAQCAAGTIHDDVAAIAARSRPYFLVDVLDHLLAPVMLEVDIDVGRLVTLARR